MKGMEVLSLLLLATTCLLVRAQDLVQSDDGTGLMTILFKQPLWNPPNIYYNDGNGWVNGSGVAMVTSERGGNYSATDGWWQYSLNASSLEFVFNYDGVWDSNNNNNYKASSAGVWAVVSTITEAPRPEVLVKSDDGSGMMTILYKQPYWDAPNIHYNAFDGNGWTNVPGFAMNTSTYSGYAATDGWWQYTIKTSELEFVFNQNGVWDNNENYNYKVSAAGVWSVVSTITDVPKPEASPYIAGAGYAVTGVRDSGSRVQLQLTLQNASNITEQYGADLTNLVVDVTSAGSSLRVKISDKSTKRWEVPTSLYDSDAGISKLGQALNNLEALFGSSKLSFQYTKAPFTFQIVRKSDKFVLFNSSAVDLVVKDQYLQIATVIPTDVNLYGIGESTRATMRLESGQKHTLWARDQGSNARDTNTYGSHPFYMGLNAAGQAHGVLLHNSNGMDVTVTDNALVYQVLGGILDLHFIAGPTPADVVNQYTSLIGRPKMMPYWSYGWHQCRWGYYSAAKLQEIVDKYAENKIPLDVMWADIDYMNQFHDFTLDPANFTQADMAKFINNIHASGHHFVPIIDPGIPDDTSDAAYTNGLAMNVFIKDTDGKPYLGQVWPGPTVFPDFFHPNASNYWGAQLERMHKNLAFDGLWIDMNELANFCPGTTCARQTGVTCPGTGGIDVITTCCLSCTDDKNKWNHPEFAINNGNSHDPIFNKGISTSSLQYGNIRQYDSHNLYGFTEAIATNAHNEKLQGNKRSFILSRSTFVGSGAHTAHWTGDNQATWNDIGWSIPTILKFGLFGIPMVGADICGFSGDSNMELCARWTALGAFYPFARNHNNIQSIPQETYVWPEVAEVGRKFIGMRYRLLAYLYTLGYQANNAGLPIARPMFMQFPSDAAVRSGDALDHQYMLGDSLLVVPVLAKGATSVTGYLPSGAWYNLFDYTRIDSVGASSTWNVSLYDMPVFIRGGSILPLFQPNQTTSVAARKTAFDLVVALASDATASGSLYLDDGESLSASLFSTIVKFRAEKQRLTISAERNLYIGAITNRIQKVIVLGVTKAPKTVTANGLSTKFTYTQDKQRLEIDLSKTWVGVVLPGAIAWN